MCCVLRVRSVCLYIHHAGELVANEHWAKQCVNSAPNSVHRGLGFSAHAPAPPCVGCALLLGCLLLSRLLFSSPGLRFQFELLLP